MIAEANVVEESIESKVPLMIMFLGNEYDDVSTAVLPFTRDYIQVCVLFDVARQPLEAMK